MSNVKIVTESSTALPRDLTAEYDIRVVSLGYVYKNKVFRDDLDITTEDFWKIFPSFEEIPTTSAASLGDFRRIFLDLASQTKDIICLTMSKSLSATHKAAEQAAQIVMEEKPGLNIKVIDSQTGSAALGLIVIEAARAAQKGQSLDEVVGVVRNMMPRVKYFMILESLKYIMKVGRAPDAKDQAAKPQSVIPPISPIMGIVKTEAGVLENLDRGSNIDEALAKAIDMVKKYIDSSQPVHFLLVHPDQPEKCREIKDILAKKYNCAEIFIGRLTPSMLVSCGPTYFLGFYI
jgi:DegV family protein with EDD domain